MSKQERGTEVEVEVDEGTGKDRRRKTKKEETGGVLLVEGGQLGRGDQVEGGEGTQGRTG